MISSPIGSRTCSLIMLGSIQPAEVRTGGRLFRSPLLRFSAAQMPFGRGGYRSTVANADHSSGVSNSYSATSGRSGLPNAPACTNGACAMSQPFSRMRS
jgi:hypothetical protein